MAVLINRVRDHQIYSGYGVADDVNAYLTYPFIRTPHLWRNCVPIPLARNWGNTLTLAVTCIVFGYVIFNTTQKSIWGALLEVGVLYLGILGAEIYHWFAVGRRFHWYLHKNLLHALMRQQQYPQEKISIVTEELRRRNLLIEY